MTEIEQELPDLFMLYERHPGLTREVASSNAQAACVCLQRHHESPRSVRISTGEDSEIRTYRVIWLLPDARARRSWANPDDATETGAYAVALASLEARHGLVALARTGRYSGSDWWIGESGSHVDGDGELNLEAAIRLEVSGIDLLRDESQLRSRVAAKLRQATRPSGTAAKAVVVVFSALRVAFRDTQIVR